MESCVGRVRRWSAISPTTRDTVVRPSRVIARRAASIDIAQSWSRSDHIWSTWHQEHQASSAWRCCRQSFGREAFLAGAEWRHARQRLRRGSQRLGKTPACGLEKALGEWPVQAPNHPTERAVRGVLQRGVERGSQSWPLPGFASRACTLPTRRACPTASRREAARGGRLIAACTAGLRFLLDARRVDLRG